MKYFVIHSGRDLAQVMELMSEWSEVYGNAQFIVLEGTQENWEGDATARIRECGKVLYIVGEKSAESPFIQIELDIAFKENKEIYVFKLKDSNPINDSLIRCRRNDRTAAGELEGEIIISKNKERIFFLSEDDLRRRMSIDSQEIEHILRGNDFENMDTLMEQYKLFVRTSEDLVSRKQSVNTYYVTLSSLLLSAIVSIICAAGDLAKVFSSINVLYYISAFLSLIGIVICGSWITLLNSYSDLNASKMAVINCIEEHLALKLYDTEWTLLTRRIGKKKYRSFTFKEVAVAKIFVCLFAVPIVLCIVLSCLNTVG